MKQLELALPRKTRRRRGAGRPRLHARPGLIGREVPHLRRAPFEKRMAVHVTQRVRPGVGHLRSQGNARILLDAFRGESGLLRVVHYSIQGNHLHLIVEAEALLALSRGMQGLTIRIARRLNARLGRRGKVFVERFHSHLLHTRREVANAVRYVLGNLGRHRGAEVDDPLAGIMHPPRLWLLTPAAVESG
jgi:putative transposase